MSPPTTANRDPAEYLASVLPLNPIFQAEEILAARDRFLGRSSCSAAASASWQLQEQREALQSQIDELRQQFWTTKPKELREALESLAVDQFPDLKLAAERLQAAFRVRAEFPKLSQHKHCDQELFEKLKEIAVAAPRDAGRTKQAFFLRSSSNLKLHHRCRAMIKALRREFPEIFELEREWLQQVEQTKPIAGQTVSEKEAVQRSKSGVSGGVGWLVAVFLLSGLGRACMHSSPRSTPTPAFTPQQQQQQQEAIKRLLEAQHQTPPNNPSGEAIPQSVPADLDAARRRVEEIRQQSRERLDRARNRLPGAPPSGSMQPRGP